MSKLFAYSQLTLKAVDGAKRILRGTATTPTPDRMGDIVEPKGLEFALPLPFLWQHEGEKPVGKVTKAAVTRNGIDVEIELDKPVEGDPPSVVDRLETAWSDIKAGRVRGLSIGFKSLEIAILESGGIRFLKSLWLELSGVTIAANGDCSITAIKSLDTALRAASGRTQREVKQAPGVTGIPTQRPKGTAMKTLKELQETLQTITARQTELLEPIKAKTASEAELAEFDELETEIKELETEIRIASFDERQAARAKSVDGSSREAAARSRSARDNPVTKNTDPEDKFPGQSFARIVKTKATAFILGESQVTVAQHMFGKTHPNLVQHIKAAVAGGGTGSGEWGSELVGIDNRYTGDFVNYLYGVTGFDKLGLREAPRNVSVKGMDAPAVGYWTGESKAIKASAPSASSTDLTALKIAGKCVISNELAMDSSPGAEGIVRDALGEALALTLDQTFFSATAASAGVSPAGIVNGLAQIAMGGTDAAAFRAFMNAAAAGFISAKTSSGLILAMSPGTALALGMLVNALGQSEFPTLTENGGTLLGRKVVVSDNIDPSQVFLINPREIWRIGDDGVDFAVSREAMVEQDSAPTGASDTPTASSATLVSMFDTDSLAIRATRRVSYKFRRTQAAAVAWTDTADFGGVAS